jgi:hypothetical protein
MKLKYSAALGSAFCLFAVTQAWGATNLLNAPGFEGLTPGAVSDGSDNNVWASFNGGQNNMSVSTAYARSGTQSAQLGPNGANQFAGLRQNELDSFMGPSDIEGKTFEYSFWVFYATGDAPDKNFKWTLEANNPFNTAGPTFQTSGTIDVSSLIADSWTEFNGQITMPVVDPAETNPNLIINRVGMKFEQNGYVNGDSTGSFYIDDVSLAVIPEPSSALLLGLAGGLVAFGRRRRA